MMDSAPLICRQHLRFMAWADDLMTAAVAEFMPSVPTPLQHIYLAEVVWLARVSGHEDAQITHHTAPAGIDELATAFREIHAQWLGWAVEPNDFSALVAHRNLQGEAFRMPAWQIVLHLVNHGSFHRGQVAALLRANGFAPPATDLIIWYRSLPPAPEGF